MPTVQYSNERGDGGECFEISAFTYSAVMALKMAMFR